MHLKYKLDLNPVSVSDLDLPDECRLCRDLWIWILDLDIDLWIQTM